VLLVVVEVGADEGSEITMGHGGVDLSESSDADDQEMMDAGNVMNLAVGINVGIDSPREGLEDTESPTDVDRLDEDEPPLLGLNGDDVVRLIVQALLDLGFREVADHLEQVSGVQALSPNIHNLRTAALAGRWDQVEQILPDIEAFKSESDARKARFTLYRQKFLELVEERRYDPALACLQKELAPNISDEPETLHKLTTMMMCSNPNELRRSASWEGKLARQEVMRNLHRFVLPSVLLPERRLLTILRRDLEHQRRMSLYPYTAQSECSLLEDLEFDIEKLPRRCCHQLTRHLDEVWFVQFSHDGTKLASASKDATVQIWNVKELMYKGPKNALMHSLSGHQHAVSFLTWSPDDSALLTCGNGKDIRLWAADTGQCLQVFEKHTEVISTLAWMSDGEHFISGGVDKLIIFWSVLSGEPMRIVDHGTQINDIAVSNDGSRLYVVCQSNIVRAYDLVTFEEILDSYFPLPEKDNVTSMCISEDDSALLLNLSAKNNPNPEIHAWDLDSGTIVQRYLGHKQSRFVIRSCYGGEGHVLVVSGSEDCKIYLYHRMTGALIETLWGHTGTVNSVSWCPKNMNLLASASDDKTVCVWGV